MDSGEVAFVNTSFRSRVDLLWLPVTVKNAPVYKGSVCHPRSDTSSPPHSTFAATSRLYLIPYVQWYGTEGNLYARWFLLTTMRSYLPYGLSWCSLIEVLIRGEYLQSIKPLEAQLSQVHFP